MSAAALAPLPCLRRTEPSCALIPQQPGQRRMAAWVPSHATNIAPRLTDAATSAGAVIVPLFPTASHCQPRHTP